MKTPWWQARFVGSYESEVEAEVLLLALSERLEGKLFPMASDKRNAYEVLIRNEHELSFRSTSFLTDINIGLNEVKLSKLGETSLNYEVSFNRWRAYCIKLCGFLLFCGLIAFILFPNQIPSKLSFALNGVFWGLIWPWILAAMHKKSAEKCLINILDEVKQEILKRN